MPQYMCGYLCEWSMGNARDNQSLSMNQTFALIVYFLIADVSVTATPADASLTQTVGRCVSVSTTPQGTTVGSVSRGTTLAPGARPHQVTQMSANVGILESKTFRI